MFITGDSPPALTRYQSRHTAVVRNSTVGIADGPLLYAPSTRPDGAGDAGQGDRLVADLAEHAEQLGGGDDDDQR